MARTGQKPFVASVAGLMHSLSFFWEVFFLLDSHQDQRHAVGSSGAVLAFNRSDNLTYGGRSTPEQESTH